MKKISAADGTDYLYEKHNRQWRVRVRINSEIETDAPVNGDVRLEASGVGIAVSVALLDDNGNVSVDPFGRYRVFPAHVLTIQAFDKIDPESEIERVIQQQIDEAQIQVEGKDKLYNVLDKYA